MMKRTMILAAIAVTGTAVAALAHSGATGVVKDRMEAMKAMGDAVKTVTPMMRGEAEYDEPGPDEHQAQQQQMQDAMQNMPIQI